jgi:predicted nucleotide-binding protein (sugar kinase/HSP70/actin superfamily)
MRIGIPNGLLYPDFKVLIETFFAELGREIVVSPVTNRAILDLGVNCCVDEACLPIKVFHGHVRWLSEYGRCDMIFIPRIMRLRKNESICPKFCGLTEMVRYSIPDIPPLIGLPIDWSDDKGLRSWAGAVAKQVGRRSRDGQAALAKALHMHNEVAGGYARLHVDACPIDRRFEGKSGIIEGEHSEDTKQSASSIRSLQQYDTDQAPRSSITIALLGHPYNVKDAFLNMNIAEKLARMGVRIVTDEAVPEECVNNEAAALFKKPFWTFARYTYGAACHLCKSGAIDGVIYISSFACGIDSVTVELIRCETEGTPLLVLKVDEHTGEAGIDTRIEAFIDLLGRRKAIGSDDTAYGQRLSCS